MRKKFLIILAGIMIILGTLAPGAAFAASRVQVDADASANNNGSGSNNGESSGGVCSSTKIFGLDPWYAALKCETINGKSEISQSNFSGDTLVKETIPAIVGVVVKDLLFVAGFVAVAFVMYGGFLMMTSAGNPSAVEKAKKTISGALIGLVISILAYAVVTTVMSVVTGK